MESWFTFEKGSGENQNKHGLSIRASQAPTKYAPKIKRSGDRYEYRLPMDHISCSGWGPFKKCRKVETTDILTVVGFNKIRDGKPYGVVTTHCLGYQGRCPQWIINSPQIKQQMYKTMPQSWATELAGKDISGKDMSNYDLTDINLEGSICKGCSFRGSMVAWANLKSADFTDADFTNAILSESDLRGATLTRANFTNAYLVPVTASPRQFSECTGLDASNAILYSP